MVGVYMADRGQESSAAVLLNTFWLMRGQKTEIFLRAYKHLAKNLFARPGQSKKAPTSIAINIFPLLRPKCLTLGLCLLGPLRTRVARLTYMLLTRSFCSVCAPTNLARALAMGLLSDYVSPPIHTAGTFSLENQT